MFLGNHKWENQVEKMALPGPMDRLGMFIPPQPPLLCYSPILSLGEYDPQRGTRPQLLENKAYLEKILEPAVVHRKSGFASSEGDV